MLNFTNSKIYFIRSPELPCTMYVGYTTGSINNVLRTKRRQYQQYVEGLRDYEVVYDILQYENSIALFEQYPCKTKQQLIDRRLDIANQLASMNVEQLDDLRFRQRRNKPVNIFTLKQIERLIEIESERLDYDEIESFDSTLRFREIESKLDKLLDVDPSEF